ncbi:MAG: sugar phosphate isomerase/epimerase [Verrucomicrobia bacterium]|nr:sugar phosphate isomerase/epimerase [Verrucomicrobiota bacterium]
MPRHSRRSFLASALAAAAGGFVCDRATAAVRLDASIIGANTAITGFGLWEAVALLRELHFATIEIHPFGSPEPTVGEFPGFDFEQFSAAGRQKLRDALEGFQHVTAHLSYKGLTYFARLANARELAARKVRAGLEAAAYFNAELAVVHVVPPLGMKLDEAWPEMLRQYREWGDFAARHKFRLAIETGYPASLRDFVRLIREIDHEAVGCTLDVGHQIWSEEFKSRVPDADRSTPAGIRAYNDVMHEVLDALGPKVFHFHVHDIDPSVWKEHKPIGFGVIDYPRLVKRLRELDYRGRLVLEIGAPDMRAALADNKRRLEQALAAQ